MTDLPPSDSPAAPAGFDLGRLTVAVALAIPIGMSFFWAHSEVAAWVWALGCVWMLANLYCLERTIRSLLAPPETIDLRQGAIYGVLTLLGLPLLLLGLLSIARDGAALMPVTAGLTLPLVLAVLRAIGAYLVSKSHPGR